MTPEIFLNECKNAIAKVKRVAPETLPLKDSEEFSLYGLDSLDMMNFLLELEQGTGIALSDVDPAECNTVARLYAFLKAENGM